MLKISKEVEKEKRTMEMITMKVDIMVLISTISLMSFSAAAFLKTWTVKL